MYFRKFSFTVCAALLSLGAGGATNPAQAAGFFLKEQSASDIGTAFSDGAAAIDDISSIFVNPATIGFQSGHHVQTVVSGILPDGRLTSATGTTALAAPIGGGARDGEVVLPAMLPSLYAMYDFNDMLKFGVGINGPFGLETDYDRGWVGRYHAVDSELLTINVNPVMALKINERFSVGVGLQMQYIDAKLTSAVDFGTIAGGVSAPVTDGFVDLRGDDFAFGYTVGMLAQVTDSTRIGLSYRSKVDHTLEGDANFTDDIGGAAAGIRLIGGDPTLFTDTGITGDVTTPSLATLSIHHDITPRWAVMGSLTRTGWSVFDRLVVEFDNPSQPDNVTVEDWEDAWFAAIGMRYKPNDQWTLRAGYAYDESPIKSNATRTPRIPDSDRMWFAAGASWRPNDKLTLDAGYTHIILNDATVAQSVADPNNAARGNLFATYDMRAIDILALSATYRFD